MFDFHLECIIKNIGKNLNGDLVSEKVLLYTDLNMLMVRKIAQAYNYLLSTFQR